MASNVRVRRYAQAVFELALEKKELDRWQSDLVKVSGRARDAALVAVMESPKIGFEAKVELLSEQVKDLNPLARNLVHLLVSKGRFGILGEIAGEYQRLLDSYRGIGKAEVYTAIPLDEADRQRLAERLGAIFDKKMVVKAEVDPGIIGGILARVNGKLIDGTTRTKLSALKDELAGTST
ncbi:MAG: F0F1 ATP synthase subunit delta [Dehalococcoidia bacterium]|nr:F0F1 ATP synthase subunit delta [Dehalococcoidia bacterium]